MAKKMLAMLLTVLMLFSLFTACETVPGSSGETSSGSKEESAGNEESGVNLSERREITIGISKNELISSFEDNLLTEKLELDLNCDINFQLLPTGEFGLDELMRLVHSGEPLPDVFAFELSDALTYEYGSGGIFVPLNQWYENPDYAPNFHSVVSEEDKAAMLTAAASGDGNIYSMVRYEPDAQSMMPYHLYINTVWLDNLGLDIPATSDELMDVLVAFAEDDPNGNGVKDEIPLLADVSFTEDGGTNSLLALMNMFVYTGPQVYSFTLSEDGLNVIAPQVTDEYREGLRYLRDLYDASVITDDSFFQMDDMDLFRATLNQPAASDGRYGQAQSLCTVGMFSCKSITTLFPGVASGKNAMYTEYQMIPIPTGPSGKSYSPYNPPAAAKCWYVTKDAADPGFCVTLGDYFYDPEISLMARYGEKDVDWTNDETFCAQWYMDHTIMLEGSGLEQPVKDYYSIVLLRSDAVWGEETDVFWHNVQPRYVSLEFSEHIVDFYDPVAFVSGSGSYGSVTAQVKELYAGEQPTYLLPQLVYNAQEQQVISEYEPMWQPYVRANMIYFLTSSTVKELDTGNTWQINVDDDANWEAWLEDTLGYAGATVMMEAMQSAYERTEQFQSLAVGGTE